MRPWPSPRVWAAAILAGLVSPVLALAAGELKRSGVFRSQHRRRFGGAEMAAMNPALYPFTIFDAEPPRIEVPTLQELTRGATSDEEAIAEALAFYREHRSRLTQAWGEQNPGRLQALFAMYVVHVSHPYGPGNNPLSFLRYVRESGFAHCGMYGMYQSRLLDGFGLKWRYVALSSGRHGWIETDIDGRWEVFDSTINVWIDRSAFELVDRHPRRYRFFYTPWSDRSRPDARRVVEGMPEPMTGTPGALRSSMVGLGVYYFTRRQLEKAGLSVQIWKDFMPPDR